jgi:hypothetical protein
MISRMIRVGIRYLNRIWKELRTGFSVPVLVGTALLSQQAYGQVQTSILPFLTQIAESTYSSHVLALQAFGTRHALQLNREAVTAWIDARFRSFGFTEVVFDTFTANSTTQRNVIATIRGSSPSAGEIIVCAHYDSYASPQTTAPGADDNASGTAGVLEMARVLRSSGYTPRLTLRFIAFGAEELGLVGSTHYAAEALVQNRTIVQVQNYDMIGYCPEGAPNGIRVIWYNGARDLAERDSSAIRRYTSLTPVLSIDFRTQSDSYPFASRGFKAFFNIEQTFTPVYHTPRDSSTTLNMRYAAEVTRSGLALLLETDGTLTSATTAIAERPVSFMLEQNYPNPFNGQTVIRFTVPEERNVRLAITDMLGRELAVISEGVLAAGSYERRFEASTLASGVYLCRMSSGSFSQTRKLLLMR